MIKQLLNVKYNFASVSVLDLTDIVCSIESLLNSHFYFYFIFILMYQCTSLRNRRPCTCKVVGKGRSRHAAIQN